MSTKTKKKAKRKTVEVPDGEGWTRTVEVPEDLPKPKKAGRYTREVNEMSAHDLSKELVQIKIDHECGPGDVHRHFIQERERAIRTELNRRSNLEEEALVAEVKARDTLAKRSAKWDGMAPCGKHGADYEGQQCDLCSKLNLPDATIETVLTTREVLSSIERWAESCRTGKINSSRRGENTVRDLVYEIQQEVEVWVEALEEDGR